jgi:predicted metal-binding membrane protein
MVVLVAVSIMSIIWMFVITVLVLAQKLLPVRASVDVPVGLAIVGLRVLIVIDPTSIPGLMPPM